MQPANRNLHVELKLSKDGNTSTQLIPLLKGLCYSKMTFRNLNKTWRDVIFEQYEEDHAADVQFPITYLIYATRWKKDIFIEIPTKIDVPIFRQALLHASRERGPSDDPAYEDDLIKVRARVSHSSAQRNNDVRPQAGTDQSESGPASSSG
ncbi:hypothetical protein ACHAP5_003828 [Fusarium lateritium]